MPKHAFKFPPEVVAAIKDHVRHAVAAVVPARYSQEANYTAALLARLEGVAYDGLHGRVEFKATIFNDRGRNSAESRYGADHAITATISDGTKKIEKAILVQAKLGSVDDLSTAALEFLKTQIVKMQQLVPAPKVMEIPDEGAQRAPAMISGNNLLNGDPYTPMELADYFAARVTTTLDGCTDPAVVSAVQDSSLSRVHVAAKLYQKA